MINDCEKDYMISLGYSLINDPVLGQTWWNGKDWVHPREVENWMDMDKEYKKRLGKLLFSEFINK